MENHVKKATSEELIADLMVNYANYIIRKQQKKSTKRYKNNCNINGKELQKRNLMSDKMMIYLLED